MQTLSTSGSFSIVQTLSRVAESWISPFMVIAIDRKSTRLNSSHVKNSYAVFCLKKKKIHVLPAADMTESLNWWTEVCGFKETFRDASPPNYAGINRGDAYLHIAGMSDKELARKVGDQTMVRIAVQGIEAMYAEYQKHGGKVHPNGALQTKPWGTKEFGAIDPNGVCVTFQE